MLDHCTVTVRSCNPGSLSHTNYIPLSTISRSHHTSQSHIYTHNISLSTISRSQHTSSRSQNSSSRSQHASSRSQHTSSRSQRASSRSQHPSSRSQLTSSRSEHQAASGLSLPCSHSLNLPRSQSLNAPSQGLTILAKSKESDTELPQKHANIPPNTEGHTRPAQGHSKELHYLLFCVSTQFF